MSDCIIGSYISRVCEKGTKCCNVQHKTSDCSESALNDLLYLTLWIHGTAGEVDIIEFTGSKIMVEFIDFVMNVSGEDIMPLLKGLPAEEWLTVQVYPFCEDDGKWSFEVKNFDIAKI